MGLTMLVATAGGHLAELIRLQDRLPDEGAERCWITVDHPHSRSLLAGKRVLFVPDAPSRDPMAALRNARLAAPFLKQLRPDWVISNGASLGVSVLPQAALMGIRCTYIENAVRLAGPSLSGRIASLIPGIETFTQFPHLASHRWHLTESSLDQWTSFSLPAPRSLRRIVVTVGTMSWQFARLFELLARILPADASILWQHGNTPIGDLGISGVVSLPARELEKSMQEADLVIAHAGIGSAIAAFDCGKMPVLVPRRAFRHEAVDDHQKHLAEELARRGLCRYFEVDDLDLPALREAASWAIAPVPNPPLLRLPRRSARLSGAVHERTGIPGEAPNEKR